MFNLKTWIALVAMLGGGGVATAQLLPQLPSVPPIGGVIDRARPLIDDVTALPGRALDQLAEARRTRIADLVRRYPDRIALDPEGNPARAREMVVDDPDDALVARAERRGYRLIERSDVLGVSYARFATPDKSIGAAMRELRKLGAREVSADSLHGESGSTAALAVHAGGGDGAPIGMIDGGGAGQAAAQRGFAEGAPRASRHGSAVASLIVGASGVRGAAPDARLYVADVYGSDPAGGNASAIAKALGWLVGERVPVVTISLVGPANPLLARVIAAAQARGTIVVAAVGNDGPAAPPSYPASYPGVVAVTGVDARGRVLIEAGRATHLDYAAPGADMLAADVAGTAVRVRGTSFAAPLAAATILAAYPAPVPGGAAAALAAVDRQARRLGPRYGRGLVCGDCRTPPK